VGAGWLLHWLAFHTGTIDLTSPYYGFFSGFGSIILPPVLNGLALAAVFWWHHNCHRKRCWRVGRHIVNGTRWCRHHHPDGAPSRRGD
jgi:hypothetical protein